MSDNAIPHYHCARAISSFVKGVGMQHARMYEVYVYSYKAREGKIPGDAALLTSKRAELLTKAVE